MHAVQSRTEVESRKEQGEGGGISYGKNLVAPKSRKLVRNQKNMVSLIHSLVYQPSVPTRKII